VFSQKGAFNFDANQSVVLHYSAKATGGAMACQKHLTAKPETTHAYQSGKKKIVPTNSGSCDEKVFFVNGLRYK
jgi:hypothetical protein